jgi:hypothetical protein
MYLLVIYRVGHIALKSASPQAFFVAPQRKLRFSKAQLRSLRLKFFCVWKLAFLALIVAAQCALNSSKAQLRFAYCALVLLIEFCFCGATFLMLRAQLWLYNIGLNNVKGDNLYHRVDIAIRVEAGGLAQSC